MKTSKNKPVWIIIVIVLALISCVFFIDARIIGSYKVRTKTLQDRIKASRAYNPDTILNEDTTFIEDPADSCRGELRREYLDGVR